MLREWDITGDEVVAWSERVDAAHRLPELIRRLLLATTALHSIEMRADGGTRLGGWDGTVTSSRPHPFCPEGASAWELSVQGDAKKLNGDYNKRVAIPGPTPPPNATYVAVSARRVDAKRDWEDGKRKDGRWKDVRLIDADDIAMWLASAPAVARWFGGILGRPALHLLGLDEYLDTWARRTNPPLPIELLLAGRQRAHDAASVQTWAQGTDTRLGIEADVPEDALLFAAAALSAAGEVWRARTVVAESRDALRWAMRAEASEPLIILPAYDEFDASHADAAARVVIPLERRQRPNAILLTDAPFGVISELLERSGMRSADAERLAAESGGKLSALQRLCGFAGRRPWPAGTNRTALFALLLIGAWTPGNEADGATIKTLGTTPEELEQLCEELSGGSDPVCVKDYDPWGRASWRWISEADAWNDLAPTIPAALLRAFAGVAISVLSETDPKFELDLEQRFAAAIRGKVLRRSGALRAGIARSVARLAYSDRVLEPRHGPQAGSRLAANVAHRVLDPEWVRWASLGTLLPLVAEAAPHVFLDALEASIASGPSGVPRLFEEEGPFGGPHVAVVAALETLGWNAELLARVAVVAARFAVADTHAGKPGRVVNRPVRSFAALFHPFMPATAAPVDARLAALRQALRSVPDKAFDAVLDLLSTVNGGVVFPGHHPSIAPWGRISRDELQARARKEFATNISSLVDVALEFVGNDPLRWNRLLLVSNRLDDDLEERVLVAFGKLAPLANDRDHLIWAALRETLHRDTWYEGKPPPSATARRRLYELCAPKELVPRVAWLFAGPSVSLPGGDSRDWRLHAEQVAAERRRALELVWSDPDRWALLHRIAKTTTEGWVLGDALARFDPIIAADAALIASASGEIFPLDVRASYIALRVALGAGLPWLETALRDLVSGGRIDDAVEVAVRMPAREDIWDLFDKVGPDLALRFWSRVERLFVHERPESTISKAVDRLASCGNIATAVEVIFNAKDKLPTTTIVNVLQELKGDELRRFLRRPTGGYLLEELLKHLEGTGADVSTLAVLELRFLPLFRAGRYSPKHFSAAMASEPRHFVDLVCAMYRREDGTDEYGEPEAEAERRAEAAAQVLDSWEGFPGEGEAAGAEQTLYTWAKATLGELATEARLGIGTMEVAKVLARAPDHEGHWPCLAARRLLEDGVGSELADRIITAKRNLRGMTSRAVGEGGRQERALERQYRASAEALANEWPATAAMLKKLAEAYAIDAARQDAGARATRRREGLDIPPTSDELPSDGKRVDAKGPQNSTS